MSDVNQDPVSLEGAIIDCVGADPNGLATERICKLLRKTPQDLGDVFERLIFRKKLLGFAGLWFSPSAFEIASTRFLGALSQLHTVDPGVAQFNPNQVAHSAGLSWSGKSLDRIVQHLIQSGDIQGDLNGIFQKGFLLSLNDRQRALLTRVLEVLESEAINTPSPFNIAQTLGIPIQAIEEIFKLGIRAGEVVQISDVVFYTPKQLNQIKQQMLDVVGSEPFASNDLRNALGSTRKYIQPILDYFDAIGLTQKRGQLRVLLAQDGLEEG